jgi:purine nucleosidase
MTKIILDTDIGTDVDDILALILLLNSPEAELLGITTAYGDTQLRARIAYQVLALSGKTQIPIAAGNPSTLGKRDIFWPGHEGCNLDPSIPQKVTTQTSAEDFILETINRHPGEVSVVAIAPLTNLAGAILKSPQTMQQVKQIYVMGANFDMRNSDFPLAEHNIASDPEAAQIVFDSGLPIVLFPLDVTTKMPFEIKKMDQLRGSAHGLAQLLYAELKTWMQFVKNRFGRDSTYMHDPLTVAGLLNPEIITKSNQMRLNVETQGVLSTGIVVPVLHHHQPNIRVVLDVDLLTFEKLFFERVIQATTDVGLPTIIDAHSR